MLTKWWVLWCAPAMFGGGGVGVFRSECAHNTLPICNRDLQDLRCMGIRKIKKECP
jgi:hypothetical protein